MVTQATNRLGCTGRYRFIAMKRVGSIPCRWCQNKTKVGIEKDGMGSTYRIMCPGCGVMTQVGFNYPAGQRIAADLRDPF